MFTIPFASEYHQKVSGQKRRRPHKPGPIRPWGLFIYIYSANITWQLHKGGSTESRWQWAQPKIKYKTCHSEQRVDKWPRIERGESAVCELGWVALLTSRIRPFFSLQLQQHSISKNSRHPSNVNHAQKWFMGPPNCVQYLRSKTLITAIAVIIVSA